MASTDTVSGAQELITIPLPCTLTHLLASHELPLATGPLSLIAADGVEPLKDVPDPSAAEDIEKEAEKVEDKDKVIVVLKVGELAFPISKGTPFGTTTASEFSYLFRPTLPGLPSGYVRLSLPSTTSQAFPSSSPSEPTPDATASPPEELLKLRDAFEAALVSLGLLTSNYLPASASEIGDGASQSLRSGAVSVSSAAAHHNATTTPAAAKEGGAVQVPDGVHGAVDKFAGGAETLRAYTGALAGTVDGWVRTAGAKVNQAVSNASATVSGSSEAPAPAPAEEAKNDTLHPVVEAGSNFAVPLGQGVSALASSTAQATQDVVEHDAGEDAAAALGRAGDGVSAIGGTTKDAVLRTSTLWHGAQGVKGAAEEEEK